MLLKVVNNYMTKKTIIYNFTNINILRQLSLNIYYKLQTRITD